MVGMIIWYLPKDYDMSVKAVRNLVRFRKAGAEGTMNSITNLEDVSRINYSEDWLSPYDELRTELIRDWRLYERRRKESGKNVWNQLMRSCPLYLIRELMLSIFHLN